MNLDPRTASPEAIAEYLATLRQVPQAEFVETVVAIVELIREGVAQQ